ncbi:DUF58 domain-containing protein [Litoribacillus peritrichatus]|uniref:DUF58 domain-containing protein n=1 Tax=Litoribacillus peritrichatus TaxID=718191 RepID=A0ABP7MEP5_9GAMM
MNLSNSHHSSTLHKDSATGAFTDKQCLLGLANAGSKINLAKSTYALSRSSGTHHSNQRGRGMEFLESRHYQPGDDIRSIDWRVTARTGKTHTKVFAEEKEQPVFVLCDQSPYMFFGSKVRFKSVQATNIASLIAWSSLKQGDRFGGEILGKDNESRLFKLSRNRSRLLQFIEQMTEMNHALSNHDSADFGEIAEKLHQLRYLLMPGSRLYVISDLFAYTDTALKALAQLSAHTQITLFAVNDPLEISPPCTGQTQISLGDRVMSVILSKEQKQTIENQYETRKQQVVQYLNNWNIPLIPVSTTDDPVDLFNVGKKHNYKK